MKEVELTRNEFHQLVWSEPRTSISKKYFLNDNQITKICESFNIPLPHSSYWVKIRAGKKIIIKPLPDTYTGKGDIKIILREEGDDTTLPTPLSILQKEIESHPKIKLEVSDKLSSPDPLIAALKDKENYNRLDISVSDESKQRAWLFLDTLIKALHTRGHDVIVEKYQGSFAIVFGERIKFRLREKTRKTDTKDRWGSTQFEHTGIFHFNTGKYDFDGSEWRDGKLKVEQQLSNIIAKIELRAKEIIEENIRHEKARIETAEKQRLEREAEKRTEKELSNFKQLLNKAIRHSNSKMILSYIEEIEAQTDNQNGEWILWAKKKLAWYNPLTEAQDELLGNVDRDTLSLPKKQGYYY